jgi:alpha-tubulin suppressor-like RCC1 family protein
MCCALLAARPAARATAENGNRGVPATTPAALADPDLNSVTALDAGYFHTCAVTAAGAAMCWGDNWAGQLGDHTLTQRAAPVQVFGLSSGVLQVAAGGDFSCALLTGGAVKCWGDGGFGQLGAGPLTTWSTTPVAVSGLSSGVVAITAGLYHACALLTGGAVKCWGDNFYKQVGDDSYAPRSTPVAVVGLASGATALAAGYSHTCAIVSGGLKCWGHNFYDQLGSGNHAITIGHAVDVVGLSSGVLSVAAGEDHTCALVSTGAVKCWGHNLDGQLGTGDNDDYDTPVATAIASGAQTVAAGKNFTCAILSGAAKCWGALTGNGTRNASAWPRDVVGQASGVLALTGGEAHACAVRTGGEVVCWGSNGEGQLGTGVPTVRTTPVDVSGLASGVSAVAGGSGFACAVVSAAVQCWGDNSYSQIGQSTITTSLSAVPIAVAGVTSNTLALAPGDYHICALMTGGTVKCWGNGREGQLGHGFFNTQSATPVNVTGLSGIQKVTAGYDTTCAITAGSGLKCWGGYVTNTPTDVAGLSSGVLDVAAGTHFTCAVVSGGGAKCWGDNFYGQLGTGDTSTRAAPTDVVGLGSGVTAITAGWYHACALLATGGVKCWGNNEGGQLGDGTTTHRSAPVAVAGLNDAVAVEANGYQTCARTNGGGIKCWGAQMDSYGTYGGEGHAVTTPADVPSLGGGVVGLAVGYTSNCALVTGGGVKCWGVNGSGELGNGESAFSTTPAATSAPITLTYSFIYVPLVQR